MPVKSLGLFFALATLRSKSSTRLDIPSAGFAFCHLSDILYSALWSNSYMIGKKLSSSKLPSTTLQAYSYKSSNIVPL